MNLNIENHILLIVISRHVLLSREGKDDRKRRRTKYVEPFPLDSASPVESVSGKNAPNSSRGPEADHCSDDICSDMIEIGLVLLDYILFPV